MDYLWVALIGLLVGGTEIASRYRDDPWRAVRNFPAFFYIVVNVGAASMALYLIKDVFELKFNFSDAASDATKLQVMRILTAGLGAMAFFRTSLFIVRVGDKDVPLGPGAVLQVLLNVSDRAVDRARAQPRADFIATVMKGVDFDLARAALPAYCFALMQNVSSDEQSNFGRQILQLAASEMSPAIKTLTLGLALMNLVGDAVLKAAVVSLGDQIKIPLAKLPANQPEK